jgi:hypothetical protein
MKNQTKKLALTKAGKLNKSVLNMLQNCTLDPLTRKIRTGYYSGSGRFTSAHSAQGVVTELLKAQGYVFKIGNDAKRGGITGQYIKVSTVAFNFIAKLRKGEL